MRRLIRTAAALLICVPHAASAAPTPAEPTRATELATAFVAALASDDARRIEALGVDLNSSPAWFSVRNVFERYEHIRPKLLEVSDVTSDADGLKLNIRISGDIEVIGPSERRLPLARCWTLRWTGGGSQPHRLASVISDEDRLAVTLASAADAELQQALDKEFCIDPEVFLKTLADRASERGESGRPVIAWVERVSGDRDFDGVLASAMVMRAILDLQTTPASTKTIAQDALAIATQARDEAAIVSSRFTIGVAHWFAGDLDAAVKMFRSTAGYLDTTSDPQGVLIALYMAAYLDQDRFPLRQALRRIDELLDLLGRYDAPRSRMDVLFLLSELHSRLKASDSAEAYTRRALESARRIGDVRAQAMAWHNIAGHRIEMADLPMARRALDESVRLARDADVQLELLVMRARLLLLEHDSKAAEHTFEQAIAKATALGERLSEASGWSGLAEIALQRRQPKLARKHAARALELIRSGPGPVRIKEAVPTWAVRTLLGQAHRALGDVAAAEHELRLAITEIESSRIEAGELLGRSRALEGVTTPYSELLDLLVDQKRYDQALSVAEGTKARSLIDALSQAQYDDSPGVSAPDRAKESELATAIADLNRKTVAAESAEARNALERQLETARTRLQQFRNELFLRHPRLPAVRVESGDTWKTIAVPAGTTAVEFAVLEQRTLAFIVRRVNGQVEVNVVPIQVSRAELRARVERLAEHLADRDLEYKAQAAELYELLIAPLEAALADVDSIVIVPDDVLWRLPLAVIVDGQTSAFAKAPVSRAPSLRALAVARRLPERASTSLRLLAIGNPRLMAADSALARQIQPELDLDDLPEAAREAKAIARLYGAQRSTLQVGAAAHERVFKQRAGEFDVIHLATHGLLDDRAPIHSALVFASDREDSDEDGLLEAREIADLSLKAKLVVLSACETGRGRIGAGEGLVGMSWAFLAAGVKTVLVSDWKTNSAATEKLMVEFHRQLLAGHSPAASLQTAQAKLRRDARFSHPYFWAPFAIVGVGE